ncbi:MAG: hypothetical protein AB8I08_34330 [Sandaracinaceae bacterium]
MSIRRTLGKHRSGPFGRLVQGAAACLGAVFIGLFGCGTDRADPPRDMPSSHRELPRDEPSALEPPDAPDPMGSSAVNATAQEREPLPPAHATLSLADALGTSREAIERQWGPPLAAGAWVPYADGRLIRYRDGIAASAQGRVADRVTEASDDAWLGVPGGVMETCQRTREGWCAATHGSVEVERRAGVFRFFPIPRPQP